MTEMHVSNLRQALFHKVEEEKKKKKIQKYDLCQTAGVTLVVFVTFVGINKYLSPIKYGPLYISLWDGPRFLASEVKKILFRIKAVVQQFHCWFVPAHPTMSSASP